MNLEVIQLLLTCLGLIAGLATAIVAVISYRQRTAQEKAQWMDAIYRRFSSEIVRPVRKAVGQIGVPEMDRAVKLRLSNKIDELSQEDFERLEDFDRYFVFFEMLHYLLKRGILSEADIDVPFRYHLTQLEGNPSTCAWLHDYYPDLCELVEKAQDWTLSDEITRLRQGNIDKETLRSRLQERLGSHPAAIQRIEGAISRELKT